MFDSNRVYQLQVVAKQLDVYDLSLHFGFGIHFSGATFVKGCPMFQKLTNKTGEKVFLIFLVESS
jgi:hypothetical protein